MVNILRFERRVETRQQGVEPGKPRLTPTVLCPANGSYRNTKVNMWHVTRIHVLIHRVDVLVELISNHLCPVVL